MNQWLGKGSLVVSICFLAACSAVQDDLRPFTSDGCSYFPQGTKDQRVAWAHCCLYHDIAYWRGGSYRERLAADLALQKCVTRVGAPRLAWLMMNGVRTGGTPYVSTPFRWGYGWSTMRGYRKLTEDELTYSDFLLTEAGVDPIYGSSHD